MASIVLILSHPSLGHPEATVRTQFVGQSRNLWNVGGHGLGILTSKGFSLIITLGSGETESAPDGKLPCNFAWGLHGVGRDEKLRPTETALRRLVSGGSSACLPWKEPS